jgi:hypothetical protein
MAGKDQKMWSTGSACRSKYGVVCAICALTVLLVLHFVREYVLPNEFLATSFTTFPHGVIRTSSGHIFSDQPAPHGKSITDLCFVVERSRFLLNSGGFHVGHWGFALTSILGELEKHFRKYNDCFERANVIFTDSKASRNKLTKIKSSAAQSEYATSTLSVLSVLTGLEFELARYGDEKNNLTTTCYQQNTMFVDAGRFPTDDGWIGRFASNASRVISEYFKCNQSATDDVLIYNRRGTRRIRNEADVVSTLHRKGLATKILTPNELSPMEQICEVTKNRKMIITPHGGHQGSFLFKRQGVAVVVVSPKSALLECYRFFVKRSDPWYSIKGEHAWSCSAECSHSKDAFVDPSCDNTCARRARSENADVSLAALERIVAMHFRSGEDIAVISG